MRIPVWPGVRLSVWEPQNPDAVTITMACYYKPFPVRRVLSKRGWALFLVRYDWRDKGTYQPDAAAADETELIGTLRATVTRLIAEKDQQQRESTAEAAEYVIRFRHAEDAVRDVIADMEHTTGARHWAQALRNALTPPPAG